MQKLLYYLASIFKILFGFERPWQIFWLMAQRRKFAPRTIRLRAGTAFNVRSRMDIWSIKKTWLDQIYRKHGFEIQPEWCVLDVGAAPGDFAIFAARAANSRVLALEPFPESFKLLNENLALNNVKNVQTLESALGKQGGTLKMDIVSGEPVKFTSREGSQGPEEGAVTVFALSLAELLEKQAIAACDLLKLDCEGAEYDILLPCAGETLARIRRIVLEYHDKRPPHQHGELVAHLQANGFQVQTFPNPVHPHLGYLRAEQKTKA
ncbi:MAG: FkbM family methyltransferase [Anaerolineales bacterium]